jgi:hypothetical protein
VATISFPPADEMRNGGACVWIAAQILTRSTPICGCYDLSLAEWWRLRKDCCAASNSLYTNLWLQSAESS